MVYSRKRMQNRLLSIPGQWFEGLLDCGLTNRRTLPFFIFVPGRCVFFLSPHLARRPSPPTNGEVSPEIIVNVTIASKMSTEMAPVTISNYFAMSSPSSEVAYAHSICALHPQKAEHGSQGGSSSTGFLSNITLKGDPKVSRY